MQKIRKIFTAVSEKTALPTNYYQQHQSYRTSLTPVQKIFAILRFYSKSLTPLKQLTNFWLPIMIAKYEQPPPFKKVSPYMDDHPLKLHYI